MSGTLPTLPDLAISVPSLFLVSGIHIIIQSGNIPSGLGVFVVYFLYFIFFVINLYWIRCLKFKWQFVFVSRNSDIHMTSFEADGWTNSWLVLNNIPTMWRGSLVTQHFSPFLTHFAPKWEIFYVQTKILFVQYRESRYLAIWGIAHFCVF